MEKIIAVVVMIAIVVGLIAAVVMPMVNQMTAQGEAAQKDLEQLTAGLQEGQVLGATVKSTFRVHKNKITSSGEDKITFKVGSTSYTSEADLKKDVKDSSVYTEEIKYYASGKPEMYTYTLVDLSN